MSILQSIIDGLARLVRTPLSRKDLSAMLDKRAAENSQKLDWRHSIVDLMKLVGIDSSLEKRKALATELGYTGKLDGSAEMNIWLHGEVMKKLEEGHGTVPGLKG